MDIEQHRPTGISVISKDGAVHRSVSILTTNQSFQTLTRLFQRVLAHLLHDQESSESSLLRNRHRSLVLFFRGKILDILHFLSYLQFQADCWIAKQLDDRLDVLYPFSRLLLFHAGSLCQSQQSGLV